MNRADRLLIAINTALLIAVLWLAGQRLLAQPPTPAQQWLSTGQAPTR